MRHLLLVAVLLFAQLAAGAHAVEHAAGSKEGLAPHVCELCLATHDLGSVLPSLAVLPIAQAAAVIPESLTAPGRVGFPAPAARQRGPPSL